MMGRNTPTQAQKDEALEEQKRALSEPSILPAPSEGESGPSRLELLQDAYALMLCAIDASDEAISDAQTTSLSSCLSAFSNGKVPFLHSREPSQDPKKELDASNVGDVIDACLTLVHAAASSAPTQKLSKEESEMVKNLQMGKQLLLQKKSPALSLQSATPST